MTAAAIGRDGSRFGTFPLVAMYTLAVAASAVCYQGTLAMVPYAGTDGGYVKPAAASTVPAKVVGVFQKDASNASGAAGAINAEVATGVYSFINSGTTDAIDATMVGQPCYAVDDSTVARTAGSANTRPYAGRIVGMDGSQVLVEVGAPTPDPFGNIDVPLIAAADYSSAGQYLFVKGSSTTVNTFATNTTAGGDCLGVLQNAPASGAVGLVRLAGRTSVYASGSISAWARIASDGAGKTKAAQVTRCDASGASATAALTGSFTMGIALTAGTTDALHVILLQPMGAIPGTAA